MIIWIDQFKWTLFVFALSAFFPLEKALAENYALVIGGSSKKAESKQHEFARITAAASIGLEAKGYKVMTLFGSGLDDKEKEKYLTDFQKIELIQKKNALSTPNTATASNIDAAFEALLEKVQSGERIEVLLIAHGSDSCDELGPFISNDLGFQCQHTFTVFNSKGKEIQYPSEKILRYLKRLEDKGALPTIVFSSCHSGRAKAQFKRLGLTNTCAYFQNAGNELGNSCFEDDPDFAKDYTSSGEYISMRYYQTSLPMLEKDPYFSQSSCFQKTTKHYREMKMNLSSISSTYWSSRKEDLTFQSPAISSLMKFPYFTKGQIQPQISHEKTLSCEQLEMSNKSLFKQLSDLGKQISDVATIPYYQSIEEYNFTVNNLKDELNKKIPETSARLLEISILQKAVREKAENFMRQERQLIDQLFKDKGSDSDPCARNL